MKRILHVFGKMDCGGAETRTMEIYRRINHEKIQFDFLTMKKGEGYYDREINELGGKVYLISSPSTVSVITHIKEIIETIRREGPFYAVHAHTAYHAGVICLAAYIAGVKIRVVHSRSASDPNTKGLMRNIYFIIMRLFIKIFSTNMIACGKDAGYFLYGKKTMEKGKVKIIINAIDFEPYSQLEYRNPSLRQELNIAQDTFIMGHVGSFSTVKNHEFLIDILKILKEKGFAGKLILVGDGKLRTKIEKTVDEENLSDYILFLGMQSDIPNLMSMFDVLLLPSFYEGVPGVIVEAQAAGTPCIISDFVTKEVNAGLGLLEFLPIKDPRKWVELIVQKTNKEKIDKKEIWSKLNDGGFTVEKSIHKLYDVYNLETEIQY